MKYNKKSSVFAQKGCPMLYIFYTIPEASRKIERPYNTILNWVNKQQVTSACIEGRIVVEKVSLLAREKQLVDRLKRAKEGPQLQHIHLVATYVNPQISVEYPMTHPALKSGV
jgi:hypothetical protein